MENSEFLSEELFYYQKVTRVPYKSPCTRHYHNNVELYYLKEGECSYFIDNGIYNVRVGDLVIIPEGVIHKTNYSKPRHSRTLINCTVDYIPECIRHMLPKLAYIYRNPRITPEIERILDKIGAKYEGTSPFRDESIRCHMTELLLLLAENAEQSNNAHSGNVFIEETVKYIKENYMNKITLTEVAKMRSVSEEHLSRTFKKETGFGFSEYVTLLRLQKAEYMLKNEPGKSVCEIAYACGFNDSNYFSDRFKKAYGIAPSRVKPKITTAPKSMKKE